MSENARPLGLWTEPATAAVVALGPVRWSWRYDSTADEYTLQEGAPNDRAAFTWDDASGGYVLTPGTSGDAPEILVVEVGGTLHHIPPTA